MNNVKRHEASGVAIRWYELGVELLDSSTAVLDVIKTSHQRDDDRCSEMFKTWLEMKPDASWSQLVTALTNIGMNTAADNIRHSILTGIQLLKHVLFPIMYYVVGLRLEFELITPLSTTNKTNLLCSKLCDYIQYV